uniref:DUF4065 domain-containing protein n=1 Tax=candidate division WOR-3 bacterium TaxID=2052148 RepID=A0A7C4GHD6_UNCW3
MERLEAIVVGALGRQRFEPGAFFRLCRDLELVEAGKREREWVRLRRRLAEPAVKELGRRVERFEQGRGRVRVRDRKDLILLLLHAPGRLGRLGEGIRGTTRVLKLLFVMLQELGAGRLVCNPYEFRAYRFGPFTAAVYDDLEVLRRAGLVRREQLDADGVPVVERERIDEGFEFNGLTTEFRLTRRGERFARALLADARRRRPDLEPGLAVLKAGLGALPLKALVRYIYERYPEFATESEILKAVLGEEQD